MVAEDFECIFRAFSEENWRQDPERGTIKVISKISRRETICLVLD